MRNKKIKKPRLPIEAVLKLKGTHAHKSKKVYTRKTGRRKLKDMFEDFDF